MPTTGWSGSLKRGSSHQGGGGASEVSRKRAYSALVTGARAMAKPSIHTRWRGRSPGSPSSHPIQNQPAATSTSSMASSIIIGTMIFAGRMSRLGTESAFEVLARAKALERQGKDIVHLEIGEPDFDTPAHIREAAKRALDDGATHYGPAAGLPELREAIAKDIGGTRNIPVAPEQIVVTPGAKPIMYFVITALVNPGDEVIYPNPGFPIYESVINFVGGVPVPIPLREESDFGFDMPAFEKAASKKTRLIIINSPQNPTGGVLDLDQLGRIAEIAVKYQIPVLTDEIYKAFLYDGDFASITRFPGMRDLTIILDGFSKSFAMTGWRMGYGVMPVPLAEAVRSEEHTSELQS